MKTLIKFFGCFIFSLLLLSCGNNDDDSKDPAPTHGSITARVNPAGSATAMRVTSGATSHEVAPVNNVFTLNDLVPGSYSVTFVPATNYRAPAAKTAAVTAGSTTDLGETPMTKIIPTGTFSASLNGAPWAAPVPYGNLSASGELVITATNVNPMGNTDALVLTIANFRGLQTYTSPSGALATYSAISLLTGPKNWTSALGQCLITITSFDAAGKKISGTFSFKATSTDPAAGAPVTATNGAFTDVGLVIE